jgi:hypothetical protein
MSGTAGLQIHCHRLFRSQITDEITNVICNLLIRCENLYESLPDGQAGVIRCPCMNHLIVPNRQPSVIR